MSPLIWITQLSFIVTNNKLCQNIYNMIKYALKKSNCKWFNQNSSVGTKLSHCHRYPFVIGGPFVIQGDPICPTVSTHLSTIFTHLVFRALSNATPVSYHKWPDFCFWPITVLLRLILYLGSLAKTYMTHGSSSCFKSIYLSNSSYYGINSGLFVFL